MRIAVITTSYPANDDDPSGHFVRTEVEALLDAGHEVTLFVPAATRSRRDRGPRKGVGSGPGRHEPLIEAVQDVESERVRHAEQQRRTNLKRLELPHLGLFGWPGALERLRIAPWRALGVLPFAVAARRKILDCPPFERVVAHWLLPSFWPICRDFGASTVAVAHGSDVRLLERLPRLIRRRVLSALNRPSVTLRCVSAELASRLEQLGYVPAPSGGPSLWIEPAAIRLPPLPARQDLRRTMHLGPHPIVVIVGRVVASKRIEQAIRAISMAVTGHAELGQTGIFVVGDGPAQAELERQFPSVSWLGRVGRQRALEYIRAANLLVSASADEGAPTVVREALGLGTPVVARAAGDLVAWSERDPRLVVVPDVAGSWPIEAPKAIAAQLLSHVVGSPEPFRGRPVCEDPTARR